VRIEIDAGRGLVISVDLDHHPRLPVGINRLCITFEDSTGEKITKPVCASCSNTTIITVRTMLAGNVRLERRSSQLRSFPRQKQFP